MNRNFTSRTSFAHIKEDENKRLSGFLFWLVLIFIGCSLIFYLFVINPVGDTYSDVQSFEENKELIDNDNNDNNNKRYDHKKDNVLRKRKNWIEYDGNLEANASITFKINGYDTSAKYIFDFGDGTTKKCRSYRISHAYSKPGKYTVSAKVSYNDVSEAWKETLNIKEGLYVDPSAFE